MDLNDLTTDENDFLKCTGYANYFDLFLDELEEWEYQFFKKIAAKGVDLKDPNVKKLKKELFEKIRNLKPERFEVKKNTYVINIDYDSVVFGLDEEEDSENYAKIKKRKK